MSLIQYYRCENNSHLVNLFMMYVAETEALQDSGMDELDAYMTAIKSGSLDTKTRTAIKRRLVDAKREQQRLQKLANIAKPAMPQLTRCHHQFYVLTLCLFLFLM